MYTLHHEYNGTHIRDAAGGLVASLEAGSQEKRDRDAATILSALNGNTAAVLAAAKRLLSAMDDYDGNMPASLDSPYERMREELAKAGAL